jgi:hypothetical protein
MLLKTYFLPHREHTVYYKDRSVSAVWEGSVPDTWSVTVWTERISSVVADVRTADPLGSKAFVLMGHSLFVPGQGRTDCLWVPPVW